MVGSRPSDERPEQSDVVVRPPSYDLVLEDLKRLRRAGAGKLRGLHVPALRQATVLLDLCDERDTEPAPLTELLRAALDRLGGGTEQEAAELTLGLTRGAGYWDGGTRRSKAAALYGIEPDTFRKKPEQQLLAQVAEAVLELCHEARMRRTRLVMDQHRHPAESRLAVKWVERFEAYYRLWTPIYALAADLEAALETYTHEPSDHLPWDPESKIPYVPELEAQGYARSALYRYTHFLLELRRFMSQHGGLWLASDADTEVAIGDAVYRIGWHNDLNDEEDSWLRRMLADSKREESEQFIGLIRGFRQGEFIEEQWQTMVKAGVGLTEPGQQAGSQVWLTIRACHDYCDLVDADWHRVADWYRPGDDPSRVRGVNGAQLYDGLLIERGLGD